MSGVAPRQRDGALSGPACQEACPWPSRLVVMLLATKGSVCWSPSTAPAPPAVWLCSVAQVVAMKVSGTCEREKGCLSCMARAGLGGPMYLSRRSLKIETSHHHCLMKAKPCELNLRLSW